MIFNPIFLESLVTAIVVTSVLGYTAIALWNL